MIRYRGSFTYDTPNGSQIGYALTKYPIIPLSSLDIYVYTTQGDRYDVIAQNYYNDSTLWWIINRANPNQDANSIFPTVGAQIRIPAFDRIGEILLQYEALNLSI
jgi:hypothetical protein